MKQGKQSLQDLAVELQRQNDEKKDFTANSVSLKLKERENGRLIMDLLNKGDYPIQSLAHHQISEFTQIPYRYYERMKIGAQDLLIENVNHWFASISKKRLVRTLDGNVRAFLSDRYRPLDNYDLSVAALPAIAELDCKVVSCEITETRLYIKAVTERISGEVKKGDIVQAGLVVSNSEVGCGTLRVEPLVYRLACLNGAIMNDLSMRKYHIGRGNGGNGDGVEEFFTDETRQADDKAFWLKVRDTINGSLNAENFLRLVEAMRNAAYDEIKKPVEKAVEKVQEVFTLQENERENVLQHLIRGGELSRYGMSNAVTRASQDVDSYDRATELERIGGQIIELPKNDWKVIAE